MELPSFLEPSHVALDCDLAVPAPALDAASAASAAASAAAAAAASAEAPAASAVAVLAAALGHFAAACPSAADLLPVTLHAAFAVQGIC